MAAPQRTTSAPSQTAPRWPSPTARSLEPRSLSSPLRLTPQSPESNSSPQRSPNTIMQELINNARAAARNLPPPPPPTLQELLDQPITDNPFREKLIINPNNNHHFKTHHIIGSSGGSATICNGMYCVNDANELDIMELHNIYVAVKVVSMDDQEEYAKLVDQLNTTLHLDHHNLLLVKEGMVFENRFWVMFPLMDGSLRCLLKSVYSNGIPEDLVAIVLKGVLEGLANLHEQGHLHQELNAAHIYYSLRMPAIKIGYLATIYEHNSVGDRQALPRDTLPLSGICEWAAAPEIYHLNQAYTDKSDVWLVGITALELMFGGIQVNDREALELLIAEVISKKGYTRKGKGMKAVGKYLTKMMKKVKIGKSGSSSSSKGNDITFSRAFKKMLALCFTLNAEERPTAADLLRHDFFRDCDGIFDVYNFRNAVMLAERERGLSVNPPSESNAAGTSSGSNAAGTLTRGNATAAGTSTRGNAAGTSTGGNAAGSSTGGNAAGTSAGSNVAGTSAGSNVAGTSAGSNVAEGANP